MDDKTTKIVISESDSGFYLHPEACEFLGIEFHSHEHYEWQQYYVKSGHRADKRLVELAEYLENQPINQAKLKVVEVPSDKLWYIEEDKKMNSDSFGKNITFTDYTENIILGRTRNVIELPYDIGDILYTRYIRDFRECLIETDDIYEITVSRIQIYGMKEEDIVFYFSHNNIPFISFSLPDIKNFVFPSKESLLNAEK